METVLAKAKYDTIFHSTFKCKSNHDIHDIMIKARAKSTTAFAGARRKSPWGPELLVVLYST